MSFSFSIKKASNAPSTSDSAASRRAPNTAAQGTATGAATGTLAAFREALEAEGSAESEQQTAVVRPSLSFFSRKPNKKEQERTEELLKQDPKALAYDDIYEQVGSSSAKERQNKAQTRRTYLGYTEDIKDKIAKDGATADALAADAGATEGCSLSPLGGVKGEAGSEEGRRGPAARFIGKLLVQAQRRQLEREIIQERQVQKEREREGGAAEEVFVTAAYRARIEERLKVQQELERQEARDAARGKQKDLSAFHAYLLKSGAATRSEGDTCLAADHAPAAAEPTSPAVKRSETAASSVKTQSSAPQQHERQARRELDEEIKGEQLLDTSPGPSSISSKMPLTSDMVLPFKRAAEPKVQPVPEKLSNKALASARARYLNRKKLKTEEE
ncbi:uncharacterized protein LOC34622515 [Cyclospora cayetanensis]|uniref:Uncharacterized protein n=2 Tax=Cyclospora cayetanensis TaxID=88456 RepID=A0A1D3D022_9EIME|nr:uncharacterized protein LOC34622515 [Cyclospora cayetanensis]OEH76810.1 hypothetical protein cyc_06332 [Cyclospora cayetanensis]